MSPLIEINDLLLADKSNLIILDARGFAGAYDRYLAGHLDGALFVELDRDLANVPENAANGGRHPLPSPEAFAGLLTRLGITPETHIVVYDDKAGANSAARLWWMLKAIGHQQVQVLNGGLQAAINHGVALSTDVVVPQPAAQPYPVPLEFSGTVDIDEVGKAAHDDARLVIDVRENPRYLGQTEPIDSVAGHIPGAINVPFASNLDASGKYRSAEELQAAYKNSLGNVKPEDTIVHCGSGVTACHTLLALEHAGLPGAKLYVGSWSEWSRRDLPVGKEERY
ncbi:sulfurtransferase [Mucilaginibacter agri]|nr:sulfurtransferase [Mucilaginibacter agri]